MSKQKSLAGMTSSEWNLICKDAFRFLAKGGPSEWETYCKKEHKAGHTPLVVPLPEGGRVFTFAAPGYEKEETAKILKDFSKGGPHEEDCDAAVFLMRQQI